MIMLFANKIRRLREDQQLLQRQLAAALEIDTPMYSKIERGDRPAKRIQVVALAKLLSIDETELLTLWLADKISEVMENEGLIAGQALEIVKEHIIKKNETTLK
jgi:HTH-type transcriptional regulator, competence development regulator